MIRTVLGDIPPSDEYVLAHEHLVIDLTAQKSAEVVLGAPEEPHVVNDLLDARAKGLGLIADLSTPGSGRDIGALARISQRVQLPVIAATGFYWDPFPSVVEELSQIELAAVMIDEVNNGAEGTHYRCGVIKIGMPKSGPDRRSEHLFRAAVDAAQATGASIIAHTSGITQADWQIGFFRHCGLSPERTLISHFGKGSLDQALKAAEQGVFIGIDQIGFDSGPSYVQLAQLVLALCQRGHERQIILSSDMARRSRLRHFGGTSYGTVITEFIPHLVSAGISEPQIEIMLKHNPVQFFSLE